MANKTLLYDELSVSGLLRELMVEMKAAATECTDVAKRRGFYQGGAGVVALYDPAAKAYLDVEVFELTDGAGWIVDGTNCVTTAWAKIANLIYGYDTDGAILSGTSSQAARMSRDEGYANYPGAGIAFVRQDHQETKYWAIACASGATADVDLFVAKRGLARAKAVLEEFGLACEYASYTEIEQVMQAWRIVKACQKQFGAAMAGQYHPLIIGKGVVLSESRTAMSNCLRANSIDPVYVSNQHSFVANFVDHYVGDGNRTYGVLAEIIKFAQLTWHFNGEEKGCRPGVIVVVDDPNLAGLIRGSVSDIPVVMA